MILHPGDPQNVFALIVGVVAVALGIVRSAGDAALNYSVPAIARPA